VAEENMCRFNVIPIILAGYFSIFGQVISLNGTVSNSKSKPVAGANVSLAVKKLTAVTDSKGAYSMSTNVAIETPAFILPETDAISIVNNMVMVNVSGPVAVKIEMFDMRGNLLEHIIDRATSAGTYRFDPSRRSFASGMMILRIEAGSAISTFRFMPSSNGNQLISTSATAALKGSKLAKVEAVVDTLIVSAAGYNLKKVPISSYSGKNDISLDTQVLEKFSFFVTSLKAIQELSKSQNGFGGDFRFGKTGQGAGLLGADSICQCIAERSMQGSKVKQWRAFLSAAKGPDGQQVNAIDRIGNGPWYDRLGRTVALTKSDLLQNRPKNIDDDIKDDLPNEDGIPNHRPDPTKSAVDDHLTVTGSDSTGKLFSATATCEDWTSTSTTTSKPRSGLSWIRKGFGGFGKTRFGGDSQMMTNMQNWISVWSLPGCEAGIDLEESTGAGKPGVKIIGSGGGYGGFYCFALTP
jgi:hypothetical protein